MAFREIVAAAVVMSMMAAGVYAAETSKPATPPAKPAAAPAAKPTAAPAAKPAAATPAKPAAAPAKPAATAGGVMPTDIQAGVFTRAQAKRGDIVYAQHCAMCHMPDMAGKEPAPELAGDNFLSKWLDHTVGELFVRVQTTMPAGNPGTLTQAQYADVVALLLEANNFKAGAAELKADEAALEKIVIKKK